ncbi:transcriptional regulator, Crp/Fnr family [Abyssogena phaseoliformis symbiont OG214]|uniref:Crp/Fnr family transcriptional regulator n=1 Tax=Abyssogena phaseoliformis symbiont TaxID=596095 RepID=UPI001915AAAF|nr:Crp/Fnr family transcriptional regulator [Abyssogena phaseoliformis symbiont]MBW5289154.1 cAMP-binding protein [Candidatus Ruthia sp. Apha_13_S6]BBB22539.1 transcriptional regulator, Crp/Fnr family [Abyssogena phaseoliformis symbiont OG214]
MITKLLKDANCSSCTVRSRALFGSVDEQNVRLTQKYRDKHCYFSAGEILHREQNKIDYAFTLYSGCLILYNNLSNGDRQILRVTLPGDFVGFSRNSKGELPYSIKAVTDSRICLFFDANVLQMTSEHPEIAKRLIDLQLNDTVLCQQRLLNLGQKSSTEGLAYLIMELYSRIKVQSPKEFDFKTGETFFPLNQADMGDALGLTKVHINRIIATFKNEGLISCGHKKLKIINEERLSEIGQFDIGLIKDPFRHFS